MDTPTDILIVEDDPTIGRLLQEIFTLAGGSVCLAPDADAATARLNAARPALMTLDLNMPGMRGEELLAELRARPELHTIPVIIITSQLPVQHEVREQAAAVVAKPFDLFELIETVNSVLPQKFKLAA